MAVKDFIVIDKTTNLVTQLVSCEEADVNTLYPNALVVPQGTDFRASIGFLYQGDKFWMPIQPRPTGTTSMYSKLGFRRLLTTAELNKLDGFEYDAALTAEQKAKLRTNMVNFDSLQSFTLNDDIIVALMDNLFEIGYLTTERVAEIRARA